MTFVAKDSYGMDAVPHNNGPGPGFDKDSWPDMADPVWKNGIHSNYGTTPSAY